MGVGLRPFLAAFWLRTLLSVPFARWIASLLVVLLTSQGLLPGIAPAAERWDPSGWTAACYEGIAQGGECDLDDPGVKAAIATLNEASTALERLGFRAPNLPPPYTAHFWSNDICYEDVVDGQLGVSCDAGGYWYADRLLTLAYDKFFAFGEELSVDGGQEFSVPTTELLGLPIHELFHAVQNSYPGVIGHGSPSRNWVTEGMATAVESALDDVSGPNSSGLPYLDTPLDAPESLPVAFMGERYSDGGLPDYVNYPFWLFVAEEYGRSLPDGIAVFHDVLLGLSKNQGESDGVAWADSGLRSVVDEGLYEAFPAYIAKIGNDPSLYKTVHNRHHEEVFAADTRPQNSTLTLTGEVDHLAAWAYSLPVLGLSNTALEIRLVDPDDGLHLIVDGERYDTVGTGAIGMPNHFFLDKLGDSTSPDVEHTYFIRVANVGADPTQYRKRTFTLEVTLYTEYAYLHHAARVGRSAISNADIDSPIQLDFGVRSAFLVSRDSSTVVGLENPCSLRLYFHSRDTWDKAFVMIDNEGPLGAGEYPLFSTIGIDGTDLNPESHPNRFLTGFELGERNPMVEGYEQQYDTQAGTLTIERLTPHWIAGAVRMAAARRDTTRYNHPLTGPANMDVSVRFSLPISEFRGQVTYMPAADCVNADRIAFRPEPRPTPKPAPPTPKPSPVQKSDPQAEDSSDNDEGPEPLPAKPLESETEPEVQDVATAVPDNTRVVADDDPSIRKLPDRAYGVAYHVQGDYDFRHILTGQDGATITGGCPVGGPLSVGYRKGEASDDTWRKIGFETASVIPPGATGTFPLAKVLWDGPPKASTRVGVKFPQVFEGPGTLSIVRQLNEASSPLIEGTFRGTLAGPNGQEVEVEAMFRTPVTCR
ncbi:hypothetical protein ACW9UR_23375 [Halovulum sp. GXIMD14794]